jgi:hypothetical protein
MATTQHSPLFVAGKRPVSEIEFGESVGWDFCGVFTDVEKANAVRERGDEYFLLLDGLDDNVQTGSDAVLNEGDTVWTHGVITDIISGDWRLMGIYSDEKVAASKCKSDRDFIAPAKLNDMSLADKPDMSYWDGGYFPTLAT